MQIRLEGRARVLGDDINTDYIVSSSRKRDSIHPGTLKQYLLEAVDPEFAVSVKPGDVLVAGKNFGCGSAMEVAATVPIAAGIRAVVARSFARTFYRNAINNGLVPLECDTSRIHEGDWLILMILEAGVTRVRNETQDEEFIARPLAHVMLEIIKEGGLVPYLRAHRGFAV